MASIWESFSGTIGSLFDDAVDYASDINWESGLRAAGKNVLQGQADQDKYNDEAYRQGMSNMMPTDRLVRPTRTEEAKLTDYYSEEAKWRAKLLQFASYESMAQRSKVR